jgi:hypothetical protein
VNDEGISRSQVNGDIAGQKVEKTH